MTQTTPTSRIALATRTGALNGAMVWGLYGCAEFCFDSVIPYLYEPAHVLTGWLWMVGGLLLLTYLLVGLLSGATFGAVAGLIGLSAELVRPASTLLLIAAVVGQVFYRGLSATGRDLVTVCLVAGCVQLLTLAPRWRGSILRWIAHPLVVAVLLAGFPVWRVAPNLEADTSALTPVDRASSDQPNVVMLIMDTARAESTSVHGYERDTTPNLRELATQATVYERATAAGNFSLTGHAALFTGRYARRIGAHYGGSPRRAVLPQWKTVAESLREHGYSTALYGGNHAFLTRYYGMVQGFQTYKTPNLMPNSYHLRRIVQYIFRFTRIWELHRKWASAGTINDLAYEGLDDLTASKSPFFLVVNYMDAHDPLIAPPPFTDMYLEEEKLPTENQISQLGNRQRFRGIDPSPEELAAVTARYDAGIRYTDEMIGELIAYLKHVGSFDNTLLIVTSDHGDAMMKRGHSGHGKDLCDLEIRIPLVVKYPRQSEPRTVRTNVNHVDMLPTILDVVGAEIPADIDGASLAGLGDNVARTVVAENFNRNRSVMRALYSGDWKLIFNFDATFQLFNISEDSDEAHDLFELKPDKAAEMMAALDAWLAATPKFVSTHSGELDENEVERLKGLGYVQ